MNKSVFARLNNIALRVRPYFDLPVIGQVPQFGLPATLEIDGAMVNTASLIATLNALFYSDLTNCGSPGGTFTSSSGSSITLTSLGNTFVKLTNGGAVTVTLDYAYNIVNALQYPFNGQIFTFRISDTASTTVATPTLSDTAVTLAGTTTVTTGGFRDYQGQITQLFTTVGSAVTSGTTFTSLTQVGSTNAYTVALGTNAISPTVGNVIYLNVTAGTLPAGWYPVVKVSSATSFVICAPASGSAWTATAATLPGTTVVPASQYSTGSPLTGPAGSVGVYSPLVTITGMMGMAAGVMVT